MGNTTTHISCLTCNNQLLIQIYNEIKDLHGSSGGLKGEIIDHDLNYFHNDYCIQHNKHPGC